MNSDGGAGAINWQLLRRLRTALPIHSKDYVSEAVQQLLQVSATQSNSQPEFVLYQMIATIATLSKKIITTKGPSQQPTYPNMFMNVGAPPKAGKTNAHHFGDRLRRQIYIATGMNNAVPTGTIGGVYSNTVKCAKRGGLPLHAPDEGLASLNSILPLNPNSNFQPEVLLSKGWSGSNIERAKATAALMETEDARLSLLSVGTLADILLFHRLCTLHYANRGLVGRFLTLFAPSYGAKAELPTPQDQETESLVALSSEDLNKLLFNALMAVYQKVEAPQFVGFHYSDETTDLVANLHAAEAAEQGNTEEAEQWQDVLRNKLLSHVKNEFRGAEMTEKLALIFHVLELAIGSINYTEKSIDDGQIATQIEIETMRAAQAFVRRAHEQDGFFIQVSRIMASTRNREVVFIPENVDFILYHELTQILLIWPSPVVTSESFADRCAKLQLPIPFEEACAAAQSLMDYGTLARDQGEMRVTCPGILRQTRVPRLSFRFYKTHPDLLNPETLADFGIELKEYTWRYHMDYYQMVDAHSLRSQRSEKKFEAWISEIPSELQPRPGESQAGASSSFDVTMNAEAPQAKRRHQKWQGEMPELRFGPALLPQKRKRRSEAVEQPHTFRFPGEQSFSNTDI